MKENMAIDFSDTEAFHDYLRESVVFIGRCGPRRVRCAISAEALQECFGAAANTPAALFKAFTPNRILIEETASRKYESLGGNASAVLLRPRDFGPCADDGRQVAAT